MSRFGLYPFWLFRLVVHWQCWETITHAHAHTHTHTQAWPWRRFEICLLSAGQLVQVVHRPFWSFCCATETLSSLTRALIFIHHSHSRAMPTQPLCQRYIESAWTKAHHAYAAVGKDSWETNCETGQTSVLNATINIGHKEESAPLRSRM